MSASLSRRSPELETANAEGIRSVIDHYQRCKAAGDLFGAGLESAAFKLAIGIIAGNTDKDLETGRRADQGDNCCPNPQDRRRVR